MNNAEVLNEEEKHFNADPPGSCQNSKSESHENTTNSHTAS